MPDGASPLSNSYRSGNDGTSGTSSFCTRSPSQVLQRDPVNPDALWFAGLAKAQAGRAEQAAAIWRRLLEALPPEDRRTDLVRRQLEGLGRAE